MVCNMLMKLLMGKHLGDTCIQYSLVGLHKFMFFFCFVLGTFPATGVAQLAIFLVPV